MHRKGSPGKKAEGKKSTSFEVKEASELMKFLLTAIPQKSRDNIKSLLRNKQIIVDGKAVAQFNHPLQAGQKIEVRWNRVPEERQLHGIKIVFEDQDLVVIDKEEGLLSIATEDEKKETAYSLLSEYVKKQHSKNKIFVVHRLDRETSGLMVFAKSEKVKQILQDSWQETIKERTYVAVVEGSVNESEGVITSYLTEGKTFIVHSSQNPDKGQKAITHYQVIKKNKDFSLLKVSLETGRKNQIRVHMQDIGHPVAGDKKYGSVVNPLRRLSLHAWVLAFTHPVTKEELHFESSIPGKFMRLF